jgi:hypothetical protein
MTGGSNARIVTRDHFGWTGPAYRPLLVAGGLTFVRSGGDEVRGAALLTLAIELLSAPRPVPSPDAAVVVYSGVRPVDELKSRLLCHLTHAMPPDPSKLRKARAILFDMSSPVVHGDPWLRSQAVSEEVRLLAGMWSLAEVTDYLRDPGSHSFWPDRARLDAARDLYDRFRDRLILVDAPRADLPKISDHARSLRASRPIGALLLESPWADPSHAGDAGESMAAHVSILRRLAEEIGAPIVVSVAKRDPAAGSTSRAAPEEGLFHTIDIAEGTVVATRTLVLVTLRGSPTGILAFDSRSATFRQPLPGEFDEVDLLGPEPEEL